MPAALPSVDDLLWSALEAVRALGGSASLQEMDDWVIQHGGFTEEQQRIPHGDGRRTELEYRLAWARTYLKGIGALERSGGGIWTLTERGREWTETQVRDAIRTWHRNHRRGGRPTPPPDGPGNPESPIEGSVGDVDAEDAWKDALLDALRNLSPSGFERLAQRLLREAGFINVTVTGRSGDGGIDGTGVYRLSLVSFPVFFQCKRYKEAVSPRDVRDFRGAMAGRGERGLLITTGTFTPAAKLEATRDGAPPIDLIDGDALCELLKQYRLGVEVTIRTVEEVRVRHDFFADYR